MFKVQNVRNTDYKNFSVAVESMLNQKSQCWFCFCSFSVDKLTWNVFTV